MTRRTIPRFPVALRSQVDEARKLHLERRVDLLGRWLDTLPLLEQALVMWQLLDRNRALAGEVSDVEWVQLCDGADVDPATGNRRS